jgi:hypothetical protein
MLMAAVFFTGLVGISFAVQGDNLVNVKAELQAAAGKDVPGPVYVELGWSRELVDVGPVKGGHGSLHLAGGLDLHRGEEATSPEEVILDGKGGEIALYRAGGAPVVTVGEGVTLFLRNIILTGREDNNAALIKVSGYGAKLVLEDGAVIRNNTNNGGRYEAGGIVVEDGGKLEMTGGEISGNSGTGPGSSGGVYATGVFTMTGGTISGNNGAYGGGVGMGIEKAVFEMKGGRISGNSALYGGGGVYLDKCDFKMKDGEISGNNAVHGAGVLTRAVFEMSGGTINNNTAEFLGGGVYATRNFVMLGGTISENRSISGGGVYTSPKGRIEKREGGIIYGEGSLLGNTASDGRGHAVLAALGGKMRNNDADTGDNLDSGMDAGWYLVTMND